MTTHIPSTYGQATKYGAALTGSDWPGLPLRIGHMPESGRVEGLATEVDAVLVWLGGPADVTITYTDPATQAETQHRFVRSSGMVDLLPRGTTLLSVDWRGRSSTCTSVNLPEACVKTLSADALPGLDAEHGPQFGVVDTHILDLVHRLQAQAEGRDYLGAVYVQSLSLALASYISARYGKASERALPPKPASLSPGQQAQIKTFVDREIATNFGLVDLAGEVGYSPDHFSRLFKQAFEQSPHQYVLSRRIERGMAILRDETMSIAEVASACGFSSQGHFTTVFKQRTGTTPGAYRKSARTRL
jgi:AraC family transcriptional regulator